MQERYERTDGTHQERPEQLESTEPMDGEEFGESMAATQGGTDVFSDAANISLLATLAGVWLVIAPSVLGYADTRAMTNDLTLGIIVSIVSFVGMYAWHRAVGAINLIAGVWLVIAPFLLNYGGGTGAPRATYNDVILGVIIGGLGLWQMSRRRREEW